MKKKGLRIPAVYWRRLSQAVFLLLFFFLFIKTDYTGSDHIEYAVNILFRIDPFLAASVMLAARTLVVLMLPALVVIVLSLLLGRFFCGWVCPMGALLDLFHPLTKPGTARVDTLFPWLAGSVLCLVLTAAFLGLPLAGYFDPFSILVRGLSLAIYPAFDQTLTSFFTWTYREAPDFVNALTEPLYSILRTTVLPLDHKYFSLSILSAVILISVVLLNLVQRRFFCRNICPLGSMIGLTARIGLLHGRGGSEECKKCRTCRAICRMGSIDAERKIATETCILCLDCLEKCPRSTIVFSFRRTALPAVPASLSRRALLASIAGGALLPVFLPTRSIAKVSDPFLIRPPGALPESEFLSRCVRCGECMKVCIGNALHPAFLEAGFEGMFSPTLKARIGYCEFNCTLCGQVCPSGAIKELLPPEKHTLKIGHAWFDKNRCLPHAKGIPCIVCEEHCPTPEKAIQFREASVLNDQGQQVLVRQPYVVDKLCIGCGICENKCPLPDRAAVYITSAGEARNPQKILPLTSSGYY